MVGRCPVTFKETDARKLQQIEWKIVGWNHVKDLKTEIASAKVCI